MMKFRGIHRAVAVVVYGLVPGADNTAKKRKRAGKKTLAEYGTYSRWEDFGEHKAAIDFPHENPTRCKINSENENRVRKSLYRNNGSPKGVDTLKQRKGTRKETNWGSGRERCVIGGTLKTARRQGGHIIESP